LITRKPAAAGYFYESDPDELRRRISSLFTHRLGPGRLPRASSERRRESIGYVVPHAGYIYSGPIAAHVYTYVANEGRPDTFIILGPNHTGYGASIAVFPEGEWASPLGSVAIDSELSKEIVSESSFAKLDAVAHEGEHSIEVQLPFLLYFFGSTFKIVPIAMLYQAPQVARDLAKAIHKAVDRLGRDVVVIASSDMTHYEPHEVAVRKDKLAINKILSLDPEGLYNVVMSREISMCGVGPVMTLLYYSIMLGCRKAELLKYATSGDVTGEKTWVVGYAAIRFSRI